MARATGSASERSPGGGPAVGRRRQPLGRLRLQLTVWYVGTFCVILALLGGGLLVTIRHQLSRQLDDSLRDATTELARAAQIREQEAATAHGQVVDAVDELRIPDRTLHLLDVSGTPVRPDSAPAWVREAAARAGMAGEVDAERELPGEHALRLHAKRFTLSSGTPMVAVAIADRVELEDRYAALIAAFGAAAIAALVLVAGGGWLLVRKSTAPVERSIDHMRRFMADAAHELRTPLAVLRSRAEVALEQPRDAAAYTQALRGVAAESRHLGRIVEDLLTLARADAGERTIERQRIFLDDIVLDAAGSAQTLAANRGVVLSVAEYDEAPADGDAALLRQLAMILLDNAIKFTPAGGTVTVRVGSPDDRPTFSVQDSGIGITADQLPHLFDRFWRGDSARRRTAGGEAAGGGGPGVGLGLAIARWIADAHDAAITVTSTPGHGTSVTVVFPPGTAPSDASPSGSRRAAEAPVPPTAAGPMSSP